MNKPFLTALCICLASLAACVGDRGARLEEAGPEAVEAAPEADFHILMAEFAMQRGEYSVAAEEYAEAGRLSSDLGLLRRATEVNFQYGRLDDALDSAERWLAFEPESPDARNYLVRLYLRAGDVDSTVDQLEQLLENSDPPASEEAIMSARSLCCRMSRNGRLRRAQCGGWRTSTARPRRRNMLWRRWRCAQGIRRWPRRARARRAS